MALGRVKKISFKKEMKKHILHTYSQSFHKKEEQRKSNIPREEEKRKLSYAQVIETQIVNPSTQKRNKE